MHNHDPFDIAGQEKTEREREKQQRTAAYLAGEDMKWLMASKRGRRIMWRILDRSGIYRSSFTGNSETFFREGMRNVGLMLMAQVHEVCPESYTLMMKEQNERSTSTSDDGNS